MRVTTQAVPYFGPVAGPFWRKYYVRIRVREETRLGHPGRTFHAKKVLMPGAILVPELVRFALSYMAIQGIGRA